MARRLTTNQEIAGSIPASINFPFALLRSSFFDDGLKTSCIVQVMTDTQILLPFMVYLPKFSARLASGHLEF